jgi:two-component system OmpR family response regulator
VIQAMSAPEVRPPGINGSLGYERRILLVEDSEVLSRRLMDLLSEPGRLAVAAQAATQGEALERLKESMYDVLVVDIELAEGNGVAVIRHARQLYPPDEQPLIVVLTNYASDFVRDHCFAAGADYFLDKMRDISLLKPIVADGHSKWSPPGHSEH